MRRRWANFKRFLDCLLLTLSIDVPPAFEWPQPTKRLELTRYERIKELEAVLKQRVPKSDKRVTLKKAFVATIRSTTKRLLREFAEFSDEYSADLNAANDLEGFVKLAAKTWLDFQAQRFRIQLKFGGSNLITQEERLQAAMTGGLMLTREPSLHRWGNEDAERLDRERVISGQDGECVVRVPESE
jgi:hypothetical protein